jgi:sigma-E factor negative regulatory protein RseC
MSQKIFHSGTIESIEGDSMRVRIVQTSACAACKVSAHCHAAEQKEKVVDVCRVKDVSVYHPGETVMLVASSQTGMRAVTVAFLIPFLLMVAAVFVCSRFTDSEPLMALAGIVFLIPYYIVLFLFRNRLQEQFAFSVEKINNN